MTSCRVVAFRSRSELGGIPRLRRETLAVGSARFVLVSFRGGAWELYRVEPDGLEMFVGYAPEALRTIVGERGL